MNDYYLEFQDMIDDVNQRVDIIHDKNNDQIDKIHEQLAILDKYRSGFEFALTLLSASIKYAALYDKNILNDIANHALQNSKPDDAFRAGMMALINGQLPEIKGTVKNQD